MIKHKQKKYPFYRSNRSQNNKEIDYNYKFEYINTKKISIFKEILRENIIKKLINIFETELNNLKNIKNISKLYKYNKLIELVQKWCWLQYNENTKDYVIPYNRNNKYKFNVIVNTINYLLKLSLNKNELIFVNLRKKIKKFLKEEYKNFKKLKGEYIDIDKYIDNNDNIILECYHNKKKYNVNINYTLYNRLLTKLKNNNIDKNMYNICIFCLIFRYSYIDSINQQLAINNDIKYMFKKYNINFELFGSAINTISDHYCSLYYDIEKYFGSKGNVFNINLYSGIYWCNPPYDEYIMKKIAIKLKNILDTQTNIGFLITIPIWDKYTQNIIINNNIKSVERNYKKNDNTNDKEKYKDYALYHILYKYIKEELIIPKFRIPYFNHRLNQYIYASNTYMLFVYNNIDINYTNYIKDIQNEFENIIILDKKNHFIK